MRAYKIVALFTVIALNAVDAVAQSAEFKCPAPGTVVEFSDGQKTTWVSQDGSTCRIRSWPPNEQEVDMIWYAPAAAIKASAPGAWAKQVKPSNLWPLAVGKKMEARYDSAGRTGSTAAFTGSWIATLTVEKAEKITTKAGTFDTFVVSYKLEGLLPNSWKSVLRQWYAPEPGVTVKWDYSDNQGGKRSLEATLIRR